MDFLERYTSEYIGRLAHSLGQFWPASEALPDDATEARESEIFYKVSIQRMTPDERDCLVTSMRNLADPLSNYFTKEVAESGEGLKIILGIIARFPQLQESLERQKFLFLKRHRFVL
jgi:hypothetical protein